MKLKKISNAIVAVVVTVLMCLLSIVTPTYSASAANVNTSCVYYKYTGSGTYVSQYTLSPVGVVQTPTVSTYSIIGDDDRYMDFSKNGVVRLASNGGTGFVVDEHTIATAAHCVYNRTTGSAVPVTKIDFYSTSNSAANPDPVKTITEVESIHIPRNYMTQSNYYDYDYALITVEDDLSDYLCFNLGLALDGIVDTDAEVYVTGFPQGNFNAMYTGSGEIIKCNDLTLDYNTDTEHGQSGAPVYIATTFQNKVYYTVVAIHTRGAGVHNYGTRMTTNLLHFYLNNPNL